MIATKLMMFSTSMIGGMKVLAFDCSGASCSAAVLIDDRPAAQRFAPMERGHAETLLPMIETVLREAALTPAALDLLAVTVGPGSFTGLRIGLAAARGLALARKLPAIGVTSFDAVNAEDRRRERTAFHRARKQACGAFSPAPRPYRSAVAGAGAAGGMGGDPAARAVLPRRRWRAAFGGGARAQRCC